MKIGGIITNKSRITVNTLIFDSLIKKDTAQYELIEKIAELGIKNIEIRQEYIKEFDIEAEKIKNASKKYNINVFYSIPCNLFKNGLLQKNLIQNYLNQASLMNAKMAKFNIGDFNTFSNEAIYDVKELINGFKGIITVENDQTEVSGRFTNIKYFLDECSMHHIDIFYTYDAGNWIWQNEEPVKNAYGLRPYTKYIHIKDVVIKNGILSSAYIGKGIIDLKDIIKIFDSNIPVAIEYPCGDDPFGQLKKEISELIKLE